jgi:hypothetical protein
LTIQQSNRYREGNRRAASGHLLIRVPAHGGSGLTQKGACPRRTFIYDGRLLAYIHTRTDPQRLAGRRLLSNGHPQDRVASASRSPISNRIRLLPKQRQAEKRRRVESRPSFSYHLRSREQTDRSQRCADATPIGKYYYDGEGKRVKNVVPATGETTVFIYDTSGKLAAEYSTIVETQNPKVSYLTADHLGSPRINTDQNGAVTARHDNQPFGEEILRRATERMRSESSLPRMNGIMKLTSILPKPDTTNQRTADLPRLTRF